MTKHLASDFMGSVYEDKSMVDNTENDVYSLGQLNLAKKFINESASALMLRNALICWTENQMLPDNLKLYQ